MNVVNGMLQTCVVIGGKTTSDFNSNDSSQFRISSIASNQPHLSNTGCQFWILLQKFASAMSSAYTFLQLAENHFSSGASVRFRDRRFNHPWVQLCSIDFTVPCNLFPYFIWYQGFWVSMVANVTPNINKQLMLVNYIARRHGPVIWMALHNEGDWWMDT